MYFFVFVVRAGVGFEASSAAAFRFFEGFAPEAEEEIEDCDDEDEDEDEDDDDDDDGAGRSSKTGSHSWAKSP